MKASLPMHLIGSQDKTFLIFAAEHVGLVAGSDARKNLWPRMQVWLELHSS